MDEPGMSGCGKHEMTDSERVEYLRDVNGKLCAEINRQQEMIYGLVELVCDLWPRAAFTMTPVNREPYAERMREFGIDEA